MIIALIGCGKLKSVKGRDGYTAARDLYDGALFRKRVKHVESRDLPWYILSAKCGLLKPTTSIRMYDQTLADMPEIEFAEWHLGVANQLMTELYYDFRQPKLSSITIELHAGKRYCEPLEGILNLCGIRTARPAAGKGIGQQLAFYS